MSPRTRTIVARCALLAGLVLAACSLHVGRRAFIQQFFVDGAMPGDAPVWPRAPVGEGLRPAVRVRVVLLDGLSRAHALRLPGLSTICAAGRELLVDTGFPTVSLPVQSALWTGMTQQQSGLQYHIGKLPAPPADAIPTQVDSVAVAESHPEIVHSFGFARALPADEPVTPEWRTGGFAAAALAAVTSPTRLAFVHVLRIDEAGHAQGGASLRYAAAAAWSDALLALLHAAAPADATTLWVVLADHGHRAAGGHGGSEPDIRLVRACVAGGGVTTGATATIHLVDLARAIADASEARLARTASGRPWAAALADPARGATLPRPGPGRWSAAGVLVLLALLALRTGPSSYVQWGRSRRRAWLQWPPILLDGPRWLTPALGLGWMVLAALGVIAQCGWPTLSNPVVYPRLGGEVLYAGGPAWLALLLLAGFAAWRWGCTDGALVRAVLLPWSLLLGVNLVLCRLPDALVHGTPPLMPWTTGLASMLLVQGTGRLPHARPAPGDPGHARGLAPPTSPFTARAGSGHDPGMTRTCEADDGRCERSGRRRGPGIDLA
jgi:hypothetical protein